MRLILALILLAVPALTVGQVPGYIPMQPGLTGHWHDPSRGGEGLVLTVWETEAGPVYFGQTYLLSNGQQAWLAFDGVTHAAWNGESYEVVLYARDEINGEAYSVGSAWFRPNAFGGLHWTVLAGDVAGAPVVREAMLTRLTPQAQGPVGYCGQWVFAPAPPPADPVFCHEVP